MTVNITADPFRMHTVHLQDPTLPAGPCDYTGATTCDAALAGAFARAAQLSVAQVSSSHYPGGYVTITGRPGYYKLTGNQNFGIPGNCVLGGFGAPGAATFVFQNGSAMSTPTALGLSSAGLSLGATSVALQNVKNTFPAASPPTPQPVYVGGLGLCTYTGITGSGGSITLTGLSGVWRAVSSGQLCVAGPAFLSGGVQERGTIIDFSVDMQGPGNIASPAVTIPFYLQLSSGLSTGAPITSLPVNAIPGGIPNGSLVTIYYSAAFFQQWTLTAAATTGATSLTVASQTPNAAYPAGTWIANTSLSQRPASTDAIWLPGSNAVNPCSVGGFRHAVVLAGDHEVIEKNSNYEGNWAALCLESPDDSSGQWLAVDSGNQNIESGVKLDSQGWAGIYITAGNAFLSLGIGDNVHMGESPFAIFKEAQSNYANHPTVEAMAGVDWHGPIIESFGFGIIGSEDGQASLLDMNFFGGGANFGGGYNPVANFAGFSNLAELNFYNASSLIGGQGLSGGLLATVPVFITNQLIGRSDDLLTGSTLAGRGNPVALSAPNINDPIVQFKFPGGFMGGTASTSSVPAGQLVQCKGALNPPTLNTLGFQNHGGSSIPVAGVALATSPAHGAIVMATADDLLAQMVTVAVHQASTLPTSPSAAVSGATGPAANTYYYKIAHELSGGGVTAASTEVSQAVNGSQGVLISWTNAASPPHGQTITGSRVYRGTATGTEAGYFHVSGTGTSFTDTGTALTGATTPNTTNVGCEVFTTGNTTFGVRVYGTGDPGKACTAVGPNPSGGQTFAYAVAGGADNGTTAQVLMLPGDSGDGVLAANNGTDFASAATTLSNLGGVGATATQTLTNKRITQRVVTVTQSATPAINTDNTDVASITGLAQAITSMTTNLTGTPVDGDALLIRITDNGTARAITWGSSFEASTIALPTTTVISTMLITEFVWNTATSKWRCVGVA